MEATFDAYWDETLPLLRKIAIGNLGHSIRELELDFGLCDGHQIHNLVLDRIPICGGDVASAIIIILVWEKAVGTVSRCIEARGEAQRWCLKCGGWYGSRKHTIQFLRTKFLNSSDAAKRMFTSNDLVAISSRTNWPKFWLCCSRFKNPSAIWIHRSLLVSVGVVGVRDQKRWQKICCACFRGHQTPTFVTSRGVQSLLEV